MLLALLLTHNAAAEFPICDMGLFMLPKAARMTIDINNLRTAESTPKAQLQELHTGSLLKRLELLRSLQGSFEESDWLPEERDAVAAAGLIAFKNTESWKSAFLDVKAILAERENIPRGSKAKRREAAQKKQNR